MFCPNCGSPLNENHSFCENCGAPNPAKAAQSQPSSNPFEEQPQEGFYQEDTDYSQAFGRTDNAVPYGFTPAVPYRSIVVCIILTIVTCGIYGVYWLYCLVNDLNVASGTEGDTGGVAVILFTIITCGIYGLYWMYKAGGKVGDIRRRHGMPEERYIGILYLVLSLVGLGIVSYCLIQNELNQVAIPR